MRGVVDAVDAFVAVAVFTGVVEVEVGVGVVVFGAAGQIFLPDVFDHVPEFGGAGFFLAKVMVVDGAGFGAQGAAEAPVGDGHAFDLEVFEEVAGLEVVDEGLQEGLELFGGFLVVAGGDDDGLGEEAVFEGVEADAGFALGGAWSGGFSGVAAVGIDSGAGGHGGAPFSKGFY